MPRRVHSPRPYQHYNRNNHAPRHNSQLHRKGLTAPSPSGREELRKVKARKLNQKRGSMADTRQDRELLYAAWTCFAVMCIFALFISVVAGDRSREIWSLRQQLSQQQAAKYEYPTFACPRSASCVAADAVAFGQKGLFAYHVKEGRWLDQFAYMLTEADVHIAVDGNEAKKPLASVR